MSREMLFLLLTAKGPVVATVAGVKGIVLSVEREDGSGRAFNVTLRTADGMLRTVFVRTDD